MHHVLTVCAVLFACAYAHVTMIGSIGPAPNDKAFFKADAQSPCPDMIFDDSRVNVTVGQSFPVTWALVVNHNIPPSPPGRIRFRWAKGIPSGNSNFFDIAPPSPVIDQLVNYFFQQDVVITPGDTNNRATLQIVYDVNGAESPFPFYYQCINFYAVMQ